MSPRKETIRLKVAGVSMNLPIVGNAETTEMLAGRVEERIRDIEDESDRVDSQAFALQAAFSFAAEAHALQGERLQDEKELMKALDGILDGLRRLVDRLEDDKT